MASLATGSRCPSPSTAGTRRCAATWPRRCGRRTHDLAPPPPGSAERGARSAPARLRRPSGRSRRLRAPSSRPTRATPAPTARTTPAGRSAGSSWTATPPPSAPGREPHQHRGPAVRPGLRRADRARLPATADGRPLTVTEQGRHLMRLYSELDLVAAECLRTGLWDDLSVPSWRPSLSVLVFEARRPDDASPPRVPGGPGARRDHRDGEALGRSSTRSSATTTSTSCASRTGLRVGGLPLGRGRRARRRAQRRGARGRRLRALDEAAARPGRPGRRRGRRRAAARHRPRRRRGRTPRRGGLLRRSARTEGPPRGLAWVSAPSQRCSRSPSPTPSARWLRCEGPRGSLRSHLVQGSAPSLEARSSDLVDHPVPPQPQAGVQLLDEHRDPVPVHVGPGHQPTRALARAAQDERLPEHQPRATARQSMLVRRRTSAPSATTNGSPCQTRLPPSSTSTCTSQRAVPPRIA